jgi:hypothetical protein
VKNGPPPPPSRQPTDADRRRALAFAPAVLEQHLQRLNDLPAHGNAKLRADQLVLGLLLSFFDPMARSLRLIQGCGDFGGQLSLARLSRSTTSDALAAFDPELLRPLIDDLLSRCPGLAKADADPTLAGITREIIAADGTYLTTIADVASWALRHTKSDGRAQAQVRANVQLDVDTWAPRVVTVSGDDGESEPAAFAKDLLSGVLYVVDRNFVDFAFVAAVLAKGNDLVQRIKSNQPSARVVRSGPLTAEDLAAGVTADELVELTGRDAPAGTFRRVTIVTTDRNGNPETIRLLTNLTDPAAVAARVIGDIYRTRWQIELFFKWLKCFARMEHLLSTSRRGITVQLYVAVIAVLLMHVQSGRRVSIYALAALSRVAGGVLTLEQAMAEIRRAQHERDLARARQARLRAARKRA